MNKTSRSKKRLRHIITITLLSGFVLFNLIAYRHADAMLNFTEQGQRTEAPEALSFWQKLNILLTGVNIPKPRNDSLPTDVGLAFDTHFIVLEDGLTLEAWRIPHPQAKGVVLMFHGYANTKSTLLTEAKAFHDMGYSTFLVDFRGSGGSSGHQTSVGFREAEDVIASIKYVKTLAPAQPLVFYGQSMGGVAILKAIEMGDAEADALILEAVFDKMLSTVQNRFSAMGLPSFPTAHVLLFWGSVQSGYSGFAHNPVEYARNVQTPTLLLHGTGDPRVTVQQAQSIYENLRGQKQFEEFVGVGHESYCSAQPDKWRNVVGHFLAQYVPQID